MDVIRHRFPLKDIHMPAAHEVDVWLVDLSVMPMMVAQPSKPTDTPNGLVNRQRDLRIRQQFFLRLLLGRYLKKPGKDVVLTKSSAGKPMVKNAAVHFNLSHTKTWFALGVGPSGPIGIDIEHVRLLQRTKALAKRCFSAEEANALAQMEEPSASAMFLQRWTKTEALVKAQGESLARSLGEIRFSHPNQRLMGCPRHWPAPANWAIRELGFDAPIVAALASPEPILKVHLRQVEG